MGTLTSAAATSAAPPEAQAVGLADSEVVAGIVADVRKAARLRGAQTATAKQRGALVAASSEARRLRMHEAVGVGAGVRVVATVTRGVMGVEVACRILDTFGTRGTRSTSCPRWTSDHGTTNCKWQGETMAMEAPDMVMIPASQRSVVLLAREVKDALEDTLEEVVAAGGA